MSYNDHSVSNDNSLYDDIAEELDTDNSFVSLGQINKTKICTYCDKIIPFECEESVAWEALNCTVLLCYSCQPISFRACDKFYCSSHLEYVNESKEIDKQLSQSFASMEFNLINKCEVCYEIIKDDDLLFECGECSSVICSTCLPITDRDGDPYVCKIHCMLNKIQNKKIILIFF